MAESTVTPLMTRLNVPTEPTPWISVGKRADIQKRAYFGLCASANPQAVQWHGIDPASTLAAFSPDIDACIDEVRKLSDMMSRMILQPFQSATMISDSRPTAQSGLYVAVERCNLAEAAGTQITDAPACPIVMDDEVKAFIGKCGLEQDFDFVLKRLMNQFTPGKVTVLLLGSQDEESAEEHLTFLVQCDMERRAFRAGCERFYEPLRNDRLAIYTRMSVQRDI